MRTHQSLIPSLDHTACSQLEGQWLPSGHQEKLLFSSSVMACWISKRECSLQVPGNATVKFTTIFIQSPGVVLKKDAIFPRILILEGFLIDLSIYHVEVVSIPSLDGAIFSRDSLLHSNLQLCHWLLLFCPTKRHKQEKQTDKLHSLER